MSRIEDTREQARACAICGHCRERHEIEPPYPCFDCPCQGFSYVYPRSRQPLGKLGLEIALFFEKWRWFIEARFREGFIADGERLQENISAAIRTESARARREGMEKAAGIAARLYNTHGDEIADEIRQVAAKEDDHG